MGMYLPHLHRGHPTMRWSVHIGVGIGVAHLDWLGDARASMREMSSKTDSHAFLYVVAKKLTCPMVTSSVPLL